MPLTINPFPQLLASIQEAQACFISDQRKAVLEPLTHYIKAKHQAKTMAHLQFICTHNSRRSQFSQIWAQTAADYFGIKACCYSGGVEVTACNERAVASLQRSGFRISGQAGNNPVYSVFHSEAAGPILAFSKLYDHPANAAHQFAAVMTCSHADENCPFIPGAEQRIAVRYQDPKAFDNTPQEAEKYDERSLQIASEMLYAFGMVLS